MKHNHFLKQLLDRAQNDTNVLGFLVFGSVATGTHHANSDIDVISILRSHKSRSGINNSLVDGIKVGDIYLTYNILIQSINTVPYLLHPFGEAKLLFDREDKIAPLLGEIKEYYVKHPELLDEWNIFYRQNKEEKARYGIEQTSIVDVWNELEKRYAVGGTRSPFFNAFYLTSPRIFALVKKLL